MCSMRPRQKLGLLCPSLRGHIGPLPLTSLIYTSQHRFNTKKAYTRVWMPRSKGHWEAILKSGYHTFPVSPFVCAPLGFVYASHSPSLSGHYTCFLFLSPCSTMSTFVWLVSFEPFVPSLVPGLHRTQLHFMDLNYAVTLSSICLQSTQGSNQMVLSPPN